MTALTLSRQQCPITLCHKAGDLILCGVSIGLFENAGYIIAFYSAQNSYKHHKLRLSLTSELYWKEYSLTIEHCHNI